MALNKGLSRQGIKGGLQESPKSTVKVALLDKGGERGVETEYHKLREDLKDMFQSMDQKMSTRIQALDDKFTKLFREFQRDLEALKKEANEAKAGMTIMSEKVNQIEESLEFQAQIVTDNHNKHEENIMKTKGDMDKKLEEINNKLLLLEKQDRKYNLLFYGIPEERNENVYDKVRDLCLNDLEISPVRVDNMYFANGHRLPSKSNAGPRPLIIRFTSFQDRELVLEKAPKLAGSRRRILSDLPLKLKEERGRLAKIAYRIRQEEKLQTRIREQGLEIFLEVRKDRNNSWEKRQI